MYAAKRLLRAIPPGPPQLPSVPPLPKQSIWTNLKMLWMVVRTVGVKRLVQSLKKPSRMSTKELGQALDQLKGKDNASQQLQLEMMAQRFSQMKLIVDVQKAQMAEFKQQLAKQHEDAVAEASKHIPATGLPSEGDHTGQFRVNSRYGHLWLSACKQQAEDLKQLPNMYWVKQTRPAQKSDPNPNNDKTQEK